MRSCFVFSCNISNKINKITKEKKHLMASVLLYNGQNHLKNSIYLFIAPFYMPHVADSGCCVGPSGRSSRSLKSGGGTHCSVRGRVRLYLISEGQAIKDNASARSSGEALAKTNCRELRGPRRRCRREKREREAFFAEPSSFLRRGSGSGARDAFWAVLHAAEGAKREREKPYSRSHQAARFRRRGSGRGPRDAFWAVLPAAEEASRRLRSGAKALSLINRCIKAPLANLG